MRIKRQRLLLLCSLTILLSDSVWAEETSPWSSWSSPLLVDEDLVGKIWSAHDGRFVDPRSLAQSAAEAQFVLIGETHDNADHHRLQAWLIDQIARIRKPALVMEMISRDQAEVLESYLAIPDADARGLGPAIGWEETGWPDWALYQPIAEAALRLDLRLVPGGPGRDATRSVGTNGLQALADDERSGVGLDVPLPSDLGDALRLEIEEAHCGLLPEESLGPMSQVQRLRDATLANAMVSADGDGAILFAGNGHVRLDWPVPWYLDLQGVERPVLSVMLWEIEEDATSILDLIQVSPTGKPTADFFWITPRSAREDQCEELRRRLEPQD